MTSSLLQVRVDDSLKEEATAVFERLGIDASTAVRIFLKRSVLEKGIPFRMTLPKTPYVSERGVRAMLELSESAEKNGISDMITASSFQHASRSHFPGTRGLPLVYTRIPLEVGGMMTAAMADVTIAKWGNSQGVRIPRNVLDAVGLHVGDTVRLSADGETIVLTVMGERPRYKRAGHRSIEEVFAGYDGPPLGEEWLRGRVGAEVLDD